jgi:hypothetical protein
VWTGPGLSAVPARSRIHTVTHVSLGGHLGLIAMTTNQQPGGAELSALPRASGDAVHRDSMGLFRRDAGRGRGASGSDYRQRGGVV